MRDDPALVVHPRVSVVVLSGVNAEVVVTIAWDISWYQYRVSPDSDNPVRLEGRGHDPDESAAIQAETGAEPMVMRGRAMAGWLHVDATPDEVEPWVRRGVGYARTLPPK